MCGSRAGELVFNGITLLKNWDTSGSAQCSVGLSQLREHIYFLIMHKKMLHDERGFMEQLNCSRAHKKGRGKLEGLKVCTHGVCRAR